MRKKITFLILVLVGLFTFSLKENEIYNTKSLAGIEETANEYQCTYGERTITLTPDSAFNEHYKYSWYKVDNSGDKLQTTEYSLVLKKVIESGEYYCIVKNHLDQNIERTTNKTIVISKRPVSIVVDNIEAIEGEVIKTFTYKILDVTPIVEGDELNVKLTGAVNPRVAGNYDIKASIDNYNYEATIVNGVYTVKTTSIDAQGSLSGTVFNSLGINPDIVLAISETHDEELNTKIEETLMNGFTLKGVYNLQLMKDGTLDTNYKGTYTIELTIHNSLFNDQKFLLYGINPDGSTYDLNSIQDGTSVTFSTTSMGQIALIQDERALSWAWIILIVVGGVIVAGIILFLAFKPKKYRIIFDTDGGSHMDSLKVKYDDEIFIKNKPKKKNCKFGGWYVNPDLTKPFRTKYMPKRNISLFAKWLNKDGSELSKEDYKIDYKPVFASKDTDIDSVVSGENKDMITEIKNYETAIDKKTETVKEAKVNNTNLGSLSDDIAYEKDSSIVISSVERDANRTIITSRMPDISPEPKIPTIKEMPKEEISSLNKKDYDIQTPLEKNENTKAVEEKPVVEEKIPEMNPGFETIDLSSEDLSLEDLINYKDYDDVGPKLEEIDLPLETPRSTLLDNIDVTEEEIQAVENEGKKLFESPIITSEKSTLESEEVFTGDLSEFDKDFEDTPTKDEHPEEIVDSKNIEELFKDEDSSRVDESANDTEVVTDIHQDEEINSDLLGSLFDSRDLAVNNDKETISEEKEISPVTKEEKIEEITLKEESTEKVEEITPKEEPALEKEEIAPKDEEKEVVIPKEEKIVVDNEKTIIDERKSLGIDDLEYVPDDILIIPEENKNEKNEDFKNLIDEINNGEKIEDISVEATEEKEELVVPEEDHILIDDFQEETTEFIEENDDEDFLTLSKEPVIEKKEDIKTPIIKKKGIEDFFNPIKKELLSYKGIKERFVLSHNFFKFGKRDIAILRVVNGVLYLYVDLPQSIELVEQFHPTFVSEQMYQTTETLFKINDEDDFNLAFDLISKLMISHEIVRSNKPILKDFSNELDLLIVRNKKTESIDEKKELKEDNKGTLIS